MTSAADQHICDLSNTGSYVYYSCSLILEMIRLPMYDFAKAKKNEMVCYFSNEQTLKSGFFKNSTHLAQHNCE